MRYGTSYLKKSFVAVTNGWTPDFEPILLPHIHTNNETGLRPYSVLCWKEKNYMSFLMISE
jgi:hypothetical protein